MSSIILNETGVTIRRANDTWKDLKRFRMPEPLFDEFWCEGEVALLFGQPSSGKSIFAVQLGDSLARGSGLPGFRRPRGRRRVLYADLQHTDEQFHMRSRRSDADPVPKTKDRPRHRFPANLFRDRPPAGTDLCEWLRVCVSTHKIQAVIVDDLSAIRNTGDGVRETLRTMRGLRQLRNELGISILVLADSKPPKNATAVSEADLGRSRVLCTVADSVFAIGRGIRYADDHYFLQTRLRRGPVFWTLRNAPRAMITRVNDRLLGFEFDGRFTEVYDEKKCRLICEVARLAEVEGMSFREIAAELGISKSWACTLYKKWIPAMDDIPVSEPASEYVPDVVSHDDAEVEEQGDLGNEYVVDEEDNEDDGRRYGFLDGLDGDDIEEENGEFQDEPEATEIQENSAAEIIAPRRIRDLEHSTVGYGRPIYVESYQEHDRKPLIWYHQDDKGNYIRHERGTFSIKLQNLGLSDMIRPKH